MTRNNLCIISISFKLTTTHFTVLGLVKRPSLYYVNKETEWVGSEKWQFFLIFSTIYADVGE